MGREEVCSVRELLSIFTSCLSVENWREREEWKEDIIGEVFRKPREWNHRNLRHEKEQSRIERKNANRLSFWFETSTGESKIRKKRMNRERRGRERETEEEREKTEGNGRCFGSLWGQWPRRLRDQQWEMGDGASSVHVTDVEDKTTARNGMRDVAWHDNRRTAVVFLPPMGVGGRRGVRGSGGGDGEGKGRVEKEREINEG